MKVYVNEDPFPHILIENLYTEEEEILIKKELDFLLPSLKDPVSTGAALNGSEPLKRNKGIFIDRTYHDRSVSYILNINRKVFNVLEEQKNKVVHDNWFFKNQKTNRDASLISYYEDGDYYDTHYDVALYTVLSWFYKEPKSFTGGDFLFPDYDIRIECKNNMTIIFPSMIPHKVENVSVDNNKLGQGYGRWCLTQFGLYTPE